MKEKINLIFQIFGSQDSTDIDVMVFVDSLSDSIQENKELLKEYDKLLEKTLREEGYDNRPINTNLAVVKNGNIVKVFKGTPDECNNSLYHTYNNHVQMFDNQITSLVERDIQLKLLRVSRFILSLLSRTQYRKEVKLALKKEIKEQLKTINQLDLSQTLINDKNNIIISDLYKSLAFQIGQIILLLNDIEVYSKKEVILYFPSLKPFILREENLDLTTLDDYKNIFLKYAKEYLPNMTKFKEYKP